MSMKRTHVRDYVRSKHGTADHGGPVSEHNRGYEAASGIKEASASAKGPHATIKTDVYLFDDLDDKAKEKALEWAREINVDFDWGEPDVEYYRDLWKEELGLEFDKAYYDLDQADYLYLDEAKVTDVDKFLKAARAAGYEVPDVDEIYIERHFRSGGDARNYVRVEVSEDSEFEEKDYAVPVTGSTFEGVEEKLTDFLRGNLDKLKTDLKKSYDYYLSDEAVIDTIQANEYTFTKDGERFG
jgi:hypothetical protein